MTSATQIPDEVDLLLDQLKALPLIESADLDAPYAAYEAFELVLNAITRAALVQVAENKRRGKNRALFEQFVVDRFPAGRGRSDPTFATRLWKFRCDFVKGKQTGRFMLTHYHPEAHWQPADNASLILDLHGLIKDFRDAVDDLGNLLRSNAILRQMAHDELTRRTVQLIPVSLPRLDPGASAASATKDG